MGSCCSTNENSGTAGADKRACPVNHQFYKRVSPLTVLHHVTHPWHLSFEDNHYYFCDDPNCDVVYFDESGSTIKRSDVRTTIGVKTSDDNALICYCFGVTKQDYANSPAVKRFVVEQTKQRNCACETRNPSGRCCLKDFPK